MHNTLLLCYGIMHGRETLMCSLDKEALILEKLPGESVKGRPTLEMSSLVEERCTEILLTEFMTRFLNRLILESKMYHKT